MDPYSTHVPVTALALHKTAELYPTLPILECGCGYYSTPMVWLLAQGRPVTVMSADPEWASKFRKIVNVIDIELEAPKQWPDVKFGSGWGLALMDSEESVVNRATRIPALLDAAKVVVMHDAREDVIPQAKYHVVFQSFRPWTWIGSNVVDVAQWFPGGRDGTQHV